MRINLLLVSLLSDQHLIAEYNEIHGMMITYYTKIVLNKKDFDSRIIPKEYSLGEGHAKFFLDKMLFVQKRWYMLRDECIRRGFKVTLEVLDYSMVRKEHMNDYVPSKKEIFINAIRVLDRLLSKHNWYRYERVLRDDDFWIRRYRSYYIV